MPCPESFFLQYLETAAWAESSNEDDFESHEFSKEALAIMRADCDAFYDDNQEAIDRYDYERCGHDFWLTRNGHGAGFWDGDYPKEDGDKLTEASKAFGETWLTIGDDGLIYC